MRHGGRWAGRRWALLGAFAVLLGLLVLPAIVVAQSADQADQDGRVIAENDLPPNAPDTEALQAALDDAVTEDVTEPAPTQGELEQSATEFTGLSDEQALDLAREEFSATLHAELIPELESGLEPDQEVDRYIGPYAALIVPEGESPLHRPGDGPNPNLLVQSTLPLRAPEAGELEPLDSDLVETGDHFEADNAVVDSAISTDLSQGVELPDADLSVAPEGTAATEAEPVADKVFYPNAATDSDYLIAPTATGSEIFIQVRSADSPESFALDLDMPAGATLQSAPGGGAEIIGIDGVAIAAIEPPSAVDAANQPVEVEYAIAGDQLTVEVAHRDAEALYPIMVDPIIDVYNWGSEGNYDFWSWGTSNSNFYGWYNLASSGNGGLATQANGWIWDGRYYNAYEPGRV